MREREGERETEREREQRYMHAQASTQRMLDVKHRGLESAGFKKNTHRLFLLSKKETKLRQQKHDFIFTKCPSTCFYSRSKPEVLRLTVLLNC